MSINEQNITNEKEKSSSSHFLSKLKDMINTPNKPNENPNPKMNEIENNIEPTINNKENNKDSNEIKTEETIESKNNLPDKENNSKNNNEANINKEEKYKKENSINNEKSENNEKCEFKEDNERKGNDSNISDNNKENLIKKEINEEKIETKKIENENADKNKNNKNEEKEKNDKINIEEKEDKKNKEDKEEELNQLKHKDSKESKKSKSEAEEKHKCLPSCLNNCIKWILKAEIKGKRPFPKNFKSKYTFTGNSAFFKKLDFSILNTLHNSLSMTKSSLSSNITQHINTNEILENIKNESNNKLTNIDSINKIPNSPIKDTNSSVRELLNINYPIDNTKFNYSIIDANLCIKDNLKNLFFLEFDLDQLENIIEDFNDENKEQNIKENNNKSEINKDIRAIDDDCVEREIYFVLNGTFHGNKIFKNDLNFSVEYREFIKSVQFRLQNYQNKLIEMSKKLKGKKNVFQNMQTNFFGKVLTNINLGIEFSKPKAHEIMQTNFNSIVNSHIEINKILIELTIPNIFINNNKLNISNILDGINEDSISTKIASNCSPKKEEEKNNNIINNNQNNNFKKNKNYSENYNNIMFNSNMTSPNTRAIGINRSIPASPHLNDFQKLIYQQKYSPLINNNIRNNNNINMNNFANPVQNSFLSTTPNYPRSPAPGMNPQQIFCSPQPNNFSPLSASIMMMQMPYMGRMFQQQPMSINSPFNMSNYSSPYMGSTNRNNNSGLNNSNQQRKCSENIQEKIIIENTINTIGRKMYNSNHQTPVMLKRNDEEPVNKINLNQYMSPKSMGGPTSNFSLGNMNSTSFNLNNPQFNGTYYQLNPMNNINQMNQMGNMNQMGQNIPTIRQKIFENAKKEEVERINKTLNYMNRMRTNNNNMANMNTINNISNISTINNFNNSNNNIRNNNMMKNNNSNLNNFSNINTMKSMHIIPSIPNIPNISNIPNINNINNKNINNANNTNKINNVNYNNNLKHENEETREKQRIKNTFIIENQNKTNLDMFLKSVTPIYHKDMEINFLKLKIKDFLYNLKILSLHGLKNTYFNYGELVYIWYSLSLSSLSIKVTNKQLITQIFEEVKKKRKKSDSIVLKEKEEIAFVETLYTLYFTTEYMEISFSETKPVHFRKSYFSLIKTIFNSIPFFDKITVEDIDLNESYYAILYSSFKSSKPHSNHFSFVVYYHFTKEILQESKNGNTFNNEKYFKQTIVGILPIKINTEFFLQKISFNNFMIYKPIPIPPYGYYNYDSLFLRNMIYSIVNEVNKHTRSHSFDYELFVKLNKYNTNNNS